MSGKVVGESNGARSGNNVISTDVPAGSRKMVQSLKEIVNCPEAEIYATLKDCNMDPNEAVNRLLSQDPFREVKSKRDRKKENKDTADSRPRGGRGGSGRYAGRGGATPFSSNESANFHGRPANKRESGTRAYAGYSSSVSGTAGRQPPSHSDPIPTEDKILPVCLGDGISLSQPSSGHQPAWFGAPGQMSMADVVKMGRPLNQSSSITDHTNVNQHSERNNDYGIYANQLEQWPSIEKPVAASTSPVLKAPTEPELCTDPSDFQSSQTNQHLNFQMDEVHVAENAPLETLLRDPAQPDSVSSRHLQEDDSGGPCPFDDNVYNNVDAYQTQSHPIEHDEDEEDASSMAANLQQISIENHDHEALHEEDKPGVIIPDHLQVHNPECSHLSFGSFGGFESKPVSNNLEEASEVAPSVELSGNTEIYGDEHLGSVPDGNLAPLANASAGNYESSPDSHREVLKQENREAAQENRYSLSSGEHSYAYENTRMLNSTFDTPQTSSQMQNLASLSNMMQAYTNSIPSTLLAQTVQSVRELDLQYSPFPLAQSMQNKYSNNASSLSGPSISMPEVLRASGNSVPQPTQQTLPGAGLATGPILPQQLAMHPYSQPSLPLPHFSNMLGYPLLPQSYPYMPSAFQQGFAGNSSYHQSLAALLPLYKNGVSVSSLPQSATVASGYGFGNSSSVPGGNFPLNPPAAPTSTTLGYEDVLGSQYKDSNNLLSLQQQNENSPMLLQGPGSRTMPAVLASNYYSLQGQQNQQASGFRQAQQQPSQHYGSLGYPNFYQSQTEISLEQNPRDGPIGGPQGQTPQQSPQIWQNSY